MPSTFLLPQAPPVTRQPGNGLMGTIDPNQARASLQAQYPNANASAINSTAMAQINQSNGERAAALGRHKGGPVRRTRMIAKAAHRAMGGNTRGLTPQQIALLKAKQHQRMQQGGEMDGDGNTGTWMANTDPNDSRRNIRVGNRPGTVPTVGAYGIGRTSGLAELDANNRALDLRNAGRNITDPISGLKENPNGGEINNQLRQITNKPDELGFRGLDQARLLQSYYDAKAGGNPFAVQSAALGIQNYKAQLDAARAKQADLLNPKPNVNNAPMSENDIANDTPTPEPSANAPVTIDDNPDPDDENYPAKKDGGSTGKIHPYIVNEEGEEAWQPKGGKPQLMPGGEKMVVFPKDGKVITHGRTMQLAKEGKVEMPKHAATGDDHIKGTKSLNLIAKDREKQAAIDALGARIKGYEHFKMTGDQARHDLTFNPFHSDPKKSFIFNPFRDTQDVIKNDDEYAKALKEYDALAGTQNSQSDEKGESPEIINPDEDNLPEGMGDYPVTGVPALLNRLTRPDSLPPYATPQMANAKPYDAGVPLTSALERAKTIESQKAQANTNLRANVHDAVATSAPQDAVQNFATPYGTASVTQRTPGQVDLIEGKPMAEWKAEHDANALKATQNEAVIAATMKQYPSMSHDEAAAHNAKMDALVGTGAATGGEGDTPYERRRTAALAALAPTPSPAPVMNQAPNPDASPPVSEVPIQNLAMNDLEQDAEMRHKGGTVHRTRMMAQHRDMGGDVAGSLTPQNPTTADPNDDQYSQDLQDAQDRAKENQAIKLNQANSPGVQLLDSMNLGVADNNTRNAAAAQQFNAVRARQNSLANYNIEQSNNVNRNAYNARNGLPQSQLPVYQPPMLAKGGKVKATKNRTRALAAR